MLFVKFKCPKCAGEFKALRMFVDFQTTKKCSKCGEVGVPLVQEDADRLMLEEKTCSQFG